MMHPRILVTSTLRCVAALCCSLRSESIYLVPDAGALAIRAPLPCSCPPALGFGGNLVGDVARADPGHEQGHHYCAGRLGEVL